MLLTDAQALRFVRKIALDEHGCWIWRGSRTHDGYGQVTVGARRVMAHRVIYEAIHGAVHLTLDHTCRNRACVNPQHLQEVSIQENILRGDGWAARNARKTHCRNGHPLTERKVGGKGARFCRTCYRKYDREWKAKRRRER